MFRDAIDDHFERNTGFFNRLIRSKPLDLPYVSSSIKFNYNRKLGQRFYLGIGGRKITRGLRSEAIYQGDDFPTGSFSTSIIYRLHSYQIGINAAMDVYKKENFEFGIQYFFAYDANIVLRIQNNSYVRILGTSSSSGSSITHLHHAGESIFEVFDSSFTNKTYRFGHNISLYSRFNTVLKNLQVKTSITFGTSSQLQTSDEATLRFLPDGNIISASFDIGLNYNF